MKILLLDIETAPIIAAVWRTFKENVGLTKSLSLAMSCVTQRNGTVKRK